MVEQAFSDVRLAACSIGDEVVVVGVVMEDQGPVGLGLLDGKVITISGDHLVAIGDGPVIILNGANIVEVLDGETRTGSCSNLNDGLQAVVGSEKYAAAIDAAFAAALGEMSAEAQRTVAEKESILKAKQDRFQTRIDEFEAQQKLRVKKLDE